MRCNAKLSYKIYKKFPVIFDIDVNNNLKRLKLLKNCLLLNCLNF